MSLCPFPYFLLCPFTLIWYIGWFMNLIFEKITYIFVLSTMIIRIALAAPPFYNVLLGIEATVFAILLTIVSSKLFVGKQFQLH